jgi:steroid 5-alpha reductase family enzyme
MLVLCGTSLKKMSKSLVGDLSFNPSTNPFLHDVGLLRNTLFQSIPLNSGLAIITYTAARVTDRVEAKDWLWPSGQVLNAWWVAIGVRMYNGASFRTALSSLAWSEKLLLSGVTVWGLRLFYRVASRTIARGEDDGRYVEAKKEDGFWRNAFFTLFIPEAIFQSIISLPFTLAYRIPPSLNAPNHASELHKLAMGLFSAGFALETIADWQVKTHRQKSSDLNRKGVWSIVRHPK